MSCLIKESGEANIAFGAVAPTPLVIRDDGAIVTEFRRQSSVTDATLDSLIARSSPISDVRASRDYRLAMLRVFIRRAIKKALDRLEDAAGRARTRRATGAPAGAERGTGAPASERRKGVRGTKSPGLTR